MTVRTDGVYAVPDLLLRSHVDPDCGCWRWRMEIKGGTARVTILFEGKRLKMTGRRAALLLSGKSIPAGHECFARDCCPHDDCVNPAHCRSGTRGEFRCFLAARGRWSNPRYYAHLIAYAKLKRKLDDAQRLAVAVSSEPAKVLAVRYGCSVDLINNVRSGIRRAAPARSVFEWRPA